MPKPDPQTPFATAVQGLRGLSPQTIRSNDVACASLQLLFLLLRQLKSISHALAELEPQKQKPHGQGLKDIRSGMVAEDKSAALTNSFQQLVSFLGMCPSLAKPSPPLPLPASLPSSSSRFNF